MKKATLKDWATALESDNYHQGKGLLYDGDTRCHCCLGVYGALCSPLEAYDEDYFIEISADEENAMLNELILSLPPELEDRGIDQDLLTALNDGSSFSIFTDENDFCLYEVKNPLSFKEIAELLRSDLTGIEIAKKYGVTKQANT